MPAPKSRRLAGVAFALLVAALVLSLIALVGPNVLLRSGDVPRRLNKDPESGWPEYDSAGSRWPGTVRVKNLRYRDRDPGAEWGFQLDEADITYSLGDLLRRKFHVTRVSGRGFVFHARHRLAPKEATPVRLRRIPPIPGFPDPPLSGPSKPVRPPTGKEWTILVDRVWIDAVREIWIDDYRYVGDVAVGDTGVRQADVTAVETTAAPVLHPDSREAQESSEATLHRHVEDAQSEIGVGAVGLRGHDSRAPKVAPSRGGPE